MKTERVVHCRFLLQKLQQAVTGMLEGQAMEAKTQGCKDRVTPRTLVDQLGPQSLRTWRGLKKEASLPKSLLSQALLTSRAHNCLSQCPVQHRRLLGSIPGLWSLEDRKMSLSAL